MSAIDATNEPTLSNNIFIPVHSDKTPIVWDGNNATIPGALFEVKRYLKKTGIFQPLLNHRAVALSNGRLAVDSPSATYFTSGKISDPHDFDDPCPPTAKRLLIYNEDVALGTRPGSNMPALTEVPESDKQTIIIADHCVQKEDATLLRCLANVFGAAACSERLIEKADGSGIAFLEALRDRAKKATARDKALITAKYSKLIRDGVAGELTLTTFNSYLKAYKSAIRNLAPDARPPDEAEVEMVSVIAIKDAATRELYELKATITSPSTMDEAADLLIEILEGRERCEEIDEVTTGHKDLALAAPGRNAKVPSANAATDAAAPLLTALAALGIDASSVKPETLAALVAAAAPADPRKTGAGNGKKVEVPRGADGKPLRWVEGMAKCRCGIRGGKHLFKDCPKAKEKKEKAASEQAAAGALAAASAGSGDQLRAALAAILAGMVPPNAEPSDSSE